MKKILIISYFFPPCNLTASQRPYSWYVFLHKMGYHPIVITRKWEKEIKTYADVNQISTSGISIEKQPWGEIHYLPYKGNARDRIISRFGMTRFNLFRRFLTLGELVFENFFSAVIPYKNFLSHAIKLAKTETVSGAVISGGPFPQFFLGYLFNKKTKLPWIADYRDDWSTDEVDRRGGFFSRFLRKLNARSEKKWVTSAAAFTTISPYYCQKINKLVGINGHVIQNGFSEMAITETKPNQRISLLYNGTLYPAQPVEDLLVSASEFNAHSEKKIHIEFPGLGIDPVQKNRVEDFSKTVGVEDFISVTARIPKVDILDKQKNAFALVMFGHKGLRGIPSSKIYEYLSLGKPIILFEPDNDILEEIVSNYNLGYVVDKALSLTEIIEDIQRKIEDGVLHADLSYISRFSRESQVRELAALMDKYF